MTAKTYKSPSYLKQFFLRQKRKTPGFVVDTYDILQRLSNGYFPRAPFAAQAGGYEPFFIVGCGRSGNTLLRKLLMENARVAIPPEIPGLGSVVRKYSQVASKPWNIVVDEIVNFFYELADINVQTFSTTEELYCYNLKDELGIDYDQVKFVLLGLSNTERSLARIITELYHAYIYRMYGEILPWGDKTPWNVFHFDRLNKVFPKARYIHMLRDGRDCVVSYVDSLGGLMNLNYMEAAYRWCDSVRQAERIKKSIPSQFLEVRYEELTTDPVGTCSMVIDFLGLESSESKTVTPEMLGDGKALHHKKLGEKVSCCSVGRWEKDLPQNEKSSVLRIMNSDLRQMGYPL